MNTLDILKGCTPCPAPAPIIFKTAPPHPKNA